MMENVFPWIGNVMDMVIAMIQKMKRIVKVETPLIYFLFYLSNYIFCNGYFGLTCVGQATTKINPTKDPTTKLSSTIPKTTKWDFTKASSTG